MAGGGLMPSQILKMIRDGLAEALDGADAEAVIGGAPRGPDLMKPSRRSSRRTSSKSPGQAEAPRDGLAPPPPPKKKTTRSSWRRRCAKRSRRWLASRTGRPRRFAAIRENLEEALTGEYAEEFGRPSARPASRTPSASSRTSCAPRRSYPKTTTTAGRAACAMGGFHRDIRLVALLLLGRRLGAALPLARLVVPSRAEPVPARAAWALPSGFVFLATPTQTPVSLSQAAGAPVESSGARPRLRVIPSWCCRSGASMACRVDFHAIGATSRRSGRVLPQAQPRRTQVRAARRAGGRRDGDQARTRRARGFGNLSFAFLAGFAAGFFAPAGFGDLGVFGLGFTRFVPPTHSPLS